MRKKEHEMKEKFKNLVNGGNPKFNQIDFSIILFVCDIFVIIVLAMTNMKTNGKHCMVVRDNNNDFSIGFQFRFIGNNDQVVRLTRT